MSAQAVGWVFHESPYEGAVFALHLAAADIVNDAHGNELWASVATLAGKARMSERHARRGMSRLVRDGFLEVLSVEPGKVCRYRFLMPDPGHGVTPDMVSPLTNESPDPGHGVTGPLTSGASHTSIPTKENSSSSTQPVVAAEAFDEFWSIYPAKKAKGAARKAWAKAVKSTDPYLIIAGATRYCSDERVLKGYIQNPATWLNGEGWDDEPSPPARSAKSIQTEAVLNGFLTAAATRELNP